MSFLPLTPWSTFELVGTQAIEFGHRLLTRNLKLLSDGEGALSLFLSGDGKVQSLVWALPQPRIQSLRLLVPSSQAQGTLKWIDRYTFGEDFRVSPPVSIDASWSPAPQSKALGLGKLEGESTFLGTWRKTNFQFSWGTRIHTQEVSKTWLSHRIHSLIPEYLIDYDESTLLFDLGFEELCDENKGCYPGQEIVERVRTRGGLGPRKLVAFIWGQKVSPEAIIKTKDGEVIGALSHSIESLQNPNDEKYVALGFIKRGITPSPEMPLYCEIQNALIEGRFLI